ncbi:hypothetical protein Nocox_38430 [Nonomuraea coxensis DSM 45129]|uniref:Uncharacterized protein n=1 Tax=Nonomuraea coxensis DSM 45129 TaxID=1122611 RepID=A0ABX8UCR6_9ACTN|nr:hypothetical protein [Nonomuraea coxensis]QYC45236.1 hypothetical protein Nocox_38430 [Nonomuraea coxensis DSM 45129]
MSQKTDDPPAKEDGSGEEAGSAADQQPQPDHQNRDDTTPLSAEDALHALRHGGEDEAERAEAAQAAAIAARVMERLNGDPLGMRINTVALFNGRVDVAGGMSLGGGGQRAGRVTTKISPRGLARWTKGHFPPPRFDEALRVLVEHRLLILALPPGGRRTTGMNLLVRAMERHPDGGCHMVVDASVLREAQWTPPESNAGYLLVLDGAVTGLDPGLIDEQWIDDMTDRLKERTSYLVLVTGPPKGALVQAGRSGQVITTLGRLDPISLIERHLREREPTPEEAAELRRRLSDAGALELLREDPRPRTAVRLAAVIREGKDLVTAVRDLRDPTAQVHAWFSRCREPESTSFALAAAVLDDATYLTVSDAATALYKQLTPPTEAPVDLRFRERLESDHPWLQVSLGSGAVPGDVAPRVRYRNPLVRQAVLGYAWTSLDGRRSALLAWIRQLVTHPDIDVRARAAVAAGVLGWSDYDHALHRYLRQWAESNSLVLRQSAATALDVVGGHPDLTEAVWNLLEDWVAEADTPGQRRRGLTAAVTLGSRLGASRPDRATRALRVLLNREEKDWGTLLPVGLSLFRLIEHGCVSDVLSALLDWSQPQDNSTAVAKALSAFVFVAGLPAGETTAALAGPEHRPSTCPLLLAGAEGNLVPLTELWARALSRRQVQDQALETLRDYLDEHAGRDRTAYRNVRLLALAVAKRSGRHRERLLYHLDDWARAAGRRDHPAAQIRAALDQRSAYATGRT